MKYTITAPRGYTPITESLPTRPGTYRVFTKERVITTSYWDDGFEYDSEHDQVQYWSDKRRKV